MKLQFHLRQLRETGKIIGFDVQVNDADETGSRTGVVTWNDTTGNNYRDTSTLVVYC